MPRNEDGEFELILGNRQLLSVFFIVVILLGVFFTMGYIVGRNSPAPLAADPTGGKPIVVDSANRPAPTGAAVPAASDAPATTTPANPPAAEGTNPESAKAESAKPEETKPAKQEKAPPPASPLPDQPVAGQTYLQLVAVAKSEAELFVDVLSKKGFHAIYVVHPEKADTYRVLVGPFKDSAAIAQARDALVKAGFKGFDAIPRKY